MTGSELKHSQTTTRHKHWAIDQDEREDIS